MSSHSIRTLSESLLRACKQGTLSTVRATAPKLYDSNVANTSRLVPPLRIPLGLAARNGHASVLRYFLKEFPACANAERPWDPDSHIPYDDLPANWAIGSLPNAVAFDASKSGSTAVITALLDAGMHIDEDIERSGTLLSGAISRQDLGVVKFLLKRGADANNTTWYPPITILAKAASKPSLEIVKALLNHGAKLDGSGSLYEAAGAGNLETVRFLLERGCDIDEIVKLAWDIHDNEIENVRGSALHAAAENGRLEMVDWLLGKGARADLTDGFSRTARDLAEIEGKVEVVRLIDAVKQR